MAITRAVFTAVLFLQQKVNMPAAAGGWVNNG